MSTSGLGDLVSARTQATASTTAAPKSPSVRVESHPQVGASLIETRRQISQRERD
jgi:hypothetical protein